MAVLEGTSPKAKLEANYVPALTANYMIWPFVQLVNFKFVPLQHRVLFVNLISIGWNCYLSFLNSGGSKTGEGLVEEVVEEVVDGVKGEVKKEVKALKA
jgi:protein Mpv17